VILALKKETLNDLAQARNWFQVPYLASVQAWTDDYSNLFEILKWN
jgi:hypothetical protein